MRASARLGFDDSLHLTLSGRGGRENRSIKEAHSSISSPGGLPEDLHVFHWFKQEYKD